MRRNLAGDAGEFPQDVVELLTYLRPASPGQTLQAVSSAVEEVESWVLGLRIFGVQLAAVLSLPIAFASHFRSGANSPYGANARGRASAYRAGFRPSECLAVPHVMLGVNVSAAGIDAEAQRLFSSLRQAFPTYVVAAPANCRPRSVIWRPSSTNMSARCRPMPSLLNC
jgi:alkanesulfonate monooxygenase SsuD/methylene tetrahydromethanopterin reductase-like flavin-dependent oxidoreductase (luciferase family)